MARENKTKNYFLLLGLNPDEPWNQGIFEQALTSKVSEWKKLSTGISTPAREAQRNLELVPDIRNVMGDPSQRSLLARAAKEESAAKYAERRRKCEEDLDLKQSKGFLYDSELQKFIQEYSDVYSEREIRAHIKVRIVPYSGETTQAQQLDLTIEREITDSLKFLGSESLYEFLRLSQSSSTPQLKQAAEQLYAELVRHRHETVEVREQKKLAGHAMQIFSSEETRGQYHESFLRLALKPLFEHLDSIVESDPDKLLSKVQIEWFIKEASRSGLSEDSAYSRLFAHAHQRNWFPQPDPQPDPIDKQTRKQQNAETLSHMLADKQLHSADEFLKRLKSGEIADRQRYQKEINAGISKADELVRKAQSRFAVQEARINFCRMALGFCADCKEAYGLLSGLLPPPRNLQRYIEDTIVTLTWEPPSLPDVSYKVVRKIDSQPQSDIDGSYVGDFTEPVCQDTTLEPGVSAFYAVFTICDDVVSVEAARMRHPVFLTPEVTKEMVRADDQLVELTWEIPANVYAVIVRRKEKTAPLSIHDGVLIPLSTQDMSHVVDTHVFNNITYYYGIYCQFKNHEGKLVNTPGKIISVTPEATPEFIDYLDIQPLKLGNIFKVQINWSPPINGNEVILLKSEQQIVSDPGKSIPVSLLSQYGESIKGEGNSCKDVWHDAGIKYYTPVIISHNRAYLGLSHRCICMEDITELRCRKLGTVLQLDWKWPDNCQEAVIYYGNEDYPQPQSFEAVINTYRVTRKEYGYFGYFEMSGKTDQDYFIIVCAVIEHQGERITTMGDRIQVYLPPRMVIDYEIKHQGIRRKKRFLLLSTQTPGVELVSFRLVMQRHRLPLSRDDGDEFFRWTGHLELNGNYSFALPDTAVPQDTFVGLFLEDESAYEVVYMRPPALEKLRLR